MTDIEWKLITVCNYVSLLLNTHIIVTFISFWFFTLPFYLHLHFTFAFLVLILFSTITTLQWYFKSIFIQFYVHSRSSSCVLLTAVPSLLLSTSLSMNPQFRVPCRRYSRSFTRSVHVKSPVAHHHLWTLLFTFPSIYPQFRVRKARYSWCFTRSFHVVPWSRSPSSLSLTRGHKVLSEPLRGEEEA